MATTTTTGGPSKDKLKLLFNTHMVTIEVGIEREHFVVHQSFLCAKSQYFAKALSGSFQEGITRFVRLPDVSPILFRIFVAWVYHGSLVYLPRDETTIDQELESLKITKEDLEEKPIIQSEVQGKPYQKSHDSEDSDDDKTRSSITEPTANNVVHNTDSGTAQTPKTTNKPLTGVKSKYQGDDPKSWPSYVLIKLYILADRFDVRELRADTLDVLTGAAQIGDLSTIKCARYIYMNTSAGSNLRKYLVTYAAYHRVFNEDASQYEGYPVEFLAAVMVINARRLPYKLCEGCHKDAMRNCKRVVEEGGDIVPYHKDLCLYHEHANAEEKEACRLRRESSDSTA